MEICETNYFQFKAKQLKMGLVFDKIKKNNYM